ncbi:MAG: UDP-N-acetylmuramoyl-L-alanyl-D-glutamate--2,6-diaminopimelate ligase [Firmicutes bacterium]|nr:UDP-N-acetylmuramoyl-L-alanyl-D-glutamate--2,6-diaminopimelate ligase [Bacillota bacterium]
MNWKTLMEGMEYKVLASGNQEEVNAIVYDSRKVTAGSAFVAVSGGAFDGHHFVQQAAQSGAVLAVVEKELEAYPEGMTVLQVDSTLAAMPRMAVKFYDEPSKSMYMVGVTGTKGKTTTTTLIHRVLMAAGRKAGLIGTIENKIGDEVFPSQYTTPQAFDLQKLFVDMKEQQVHSVVMEVSSHSLSLHRVDGTYFDLALFSNLSLDHLDFHKTMESYLEAKMQLFKYAKQGLTNVDDPAGRTVYETGYCPMLSYAIDHEADFRAKNLVMNVHGIEYDLKCHDGRMLHITYPYPGRFNVYNTMAAVAVGLLAGVDSDIIVQELGRKDRIVRGRFQTIHGPNHVAAVVDYSHVPDALKNVLETIQEFRTNRIITVMGCGGDRDRTKRPVMGRVAGEYSDYVVATSDNPRTEDPFQILAEVEAGIKETNCPYEVIENRREAIGRAIAIAQEGDIVLVAGKGHEDYQIIGREKFHFDDVEEVEKAFMGGTV